MSLEKLVFAPPIEALFVRGLGERLLPPVRLRLRDAGLDLQRPLAVSYPLEQWKTFLDIAARALYPHLPVPEAHGWMGVHYLSGFLQTLMGQLVGELAPMLGPERMLERISQELRGGNNFTEVRRVVLSPHHIELWVSDVLCEYPTFVAGFFLRAHQLAGARNVYVDVRSFDGTACTFDVRWRDAVIPQAVTG
jgi:uncharacterized protein (TIGR02265 family)